MIARATASAALDGCKGGANMPTATTTLWQSEIDSPHAALSLACCPLELEMSSTFWSKNNAFQSNPASLDLGRQVQSARDKAQKQTTEETRKGDYSTEDKQNDEVGSAMTEEFNSSFMGVSEKERKRKHDEVRFKDWVSARATAKNPQGRERSVVPGYGGESNGYEELIKYSMSMDQARRRPSMSQYKGVQVPQPNGQWGAHIYEKHQRVWLAPFNGELDATRAYDGSFLEFQGRDAITVLSPMGDCGEEARFIRKHGDEEIIDMFPKDTYDEDFDHRSKRIIMTVARSATLNNAEERSDLRDHFCQKMKGVVDRDANASSSAAGMACLPCEHLFDKAVTPSDVGKLNRLVIPKQHAEKYFPLDINQSEKGLLLDFEDNTGKVWTFRYSYWNSSQSYVLTKGWTRFVKDKKLEAGDIVSFQRGSSERQQLYISWRPRPSGLARFRAGPQPHQSKAGVAYRVKAGSSSLNPFNPRTQANVLYNSQSMPNFWPSSTNPNASTLFNSQYPVSPFVSKVALSSQTPVTRLHGMLHPSLSAPSHIQTAQSKFYDMNPHGMLPTDLYPSLHSSLTSSDGGTNIRVPHPFVNRAPRSAAQELERPEEAESSVDLTAKKGVRVFGVILAEPQRLSAVQHHGLLNLLPAEPLR